MKRHLNDGQLRAALDGELTAADFSHLQGCAHCQQRKAIIHAQMLRVSVPLSRLNAVSPARDALPDAQKALRHFHQKLNEKEIPMFKKLFASTVFRFAATAVLLLTVTLSFPQTRALADQLLNLFRVQQVKAVFLDFTGMQEITGQSPIGEQLSQLLSSSMTVTKQSTKPVTVADAAAASQMAGFTVRLPQGQTAANIRVMRGSAFTFKIDQVKAQALLDEAGRDDLQLPASIDGKDVSISVPAGVSAAFGTCPAFEGGDPSEFHEGSVGRRYADCILFAQIPSPTVSAPADVNVAMLAQIGLEFTGMNHDEAAAFTNSIDWTSTLVIPLPKNAATYKQVNVDGVTGTLIERPDDDEPGFSLIWVKNGIIYAISGVGKNAEKAVQMAGSLP